MLNKLIILCSFLIIASTVFAKNISVPYCKADQLKIHELTCNYPGMMKTQTLYEIINVSHNSCKLYAETPSIWVIDKNDRRVLVHKNKKLDKSNYLILNPADKKSLIWFSIEATAAYDPRKLPKFNKIIVALPGLSGKTFSVNYHGYTSGILKITELQKSNRQDVLTEQ